MHLHQSCNIDDRDDMISFVMSKTLNELIGSPNAYDNIRECLPKGPGCRQPAVLGHFTGPEQGYNPIATTAPSRSPNHGIYQLKHDTNAYLNKDSSGNLNSVPVINILTLPSGCAYQPTTAMFHLCLCDGSVESCIRAIRLSPVKQP
jgi:hypothetical protein